MTLANGDKHEVDAVNPEEESQAPRTPPAAKPENDNDGSQSITIIGGYAISATWGDGVARIRDVELAQRLGYGRVRDIRKIITRMIKDGKLNDVAHRAAAARPHPGEHAQEYWLTEPQVLKVIAKSETAKADAILDEVIAVFVAWRHGRLLPPATTADLDAKLNETLRALSSLEQRVITMGTAVDSLQSGTIKREDLNKLRADVKQLAQLECAAKLWLGTRAATRDIYSEMGQATAWGGRCQPWNLLPAWKVPMAFLTLRNREVWVRRSMRQGLLQRQVPLPFAKA